MDENLINLKILKSSKSRCSDKVRITACMCRKSAIEIFQNKIVIQFIFTKISIFD